MNESMNGQGPCKRCQGNLLTLAQGGSSPSLRPPYQPHPSFLTPFPLLLPSFWGLFFLTQSDTSLKESKKKSPSFWLMTWSGRGGRRRELCRLKGFQGSALPTSVPGPASPYGRLGVALNWVSLAWGLSLHCAAPLAHPPSS